MLGQSRIVSHKKRGDGVTRLTWRKQTRKTFKTSRVFGEGTATLVGHRVYFFAPHSAGRSLYLQDLNNLKWQSVSLPGIETRYNHATELADDKIYLFGGWSNIHTMFRDSIEFDIVTRTARVFYSSGGPGQRRSMTAVWIPWRREIIYFGGIKLSGRGCNDTFAFNVDSLSWTNLLMKGTLPRERTGHDAVRFGQRMYVYGGYSTNKVYLDDLQIADFRWGRMPAWSTPLLRENAPLGRTMHTLICANGKIVCFGGYSNLFDARNSLMVYDPENDRWGDSENGLVIVEGKAPAKASPLLGVTVLDGIVYFTQSGVFKLEVDI